MSSNDAVPGKPDVPVTRDWLELALEELGEYRAIYEQLRDRPDELINVARNDLAVGVAIARADAVPRFRTWFTEQEGWRSNDERSGAIGPASVGVEWQFSGVHDKDLAFNGLAASGRAIEIRGYSIVGADGGKLNVRRYIDWAGLFGQLGLSVNWRIPLPAEPYLGAGPAQGS
jgi:hypothetical protein